VSENAPIEIVPYNSDWPGQFESESAALGKCLMPWLNGEIQHVGSTAVPGLDAKPVIDIMAPVCDLESSRAALAVLPQLGYLYWPYRAEVMHWLCKPSAAVRTHHLHLVPYGSQLWFDRLAFRDFLRCNVAVAKEYAQLKHRLAQLHRFERDAYTDAKFPFVQRVLEMASSKRLEGLAN
jgi:GrpB-like predicted nucleotidyltransferase (UPF0157 family)